MNYGIFMRVNYQDALRVGHINSGLVGSCLIKDVPTAYKTEDVRTFIIMQAPRLGATAFGDKLHNFVLLPESEWPSGTFRFPVEVFFSC